MDRIRTYKRYLYLATSKRSALDENAQLRPGSSDAI
jgi:hypothetical protein